MPERRWVMVKMKWSGDFWIRNDWNTSELNDIGCNFHSSMTLDHVSKQFQQKVRKNHYDLSIESHLNLGFSPHPSLSAGEESQLEPSDFNNIGVVLLVTLGVTWLVFHRPHTQQEACFSGTMKKCHGSFRKCYCHVLQVALFCQGNLGFMFPSW